MIPMPEPIPPGYVQLRRLVLADANFIAQWLHDPQTSWYMVLARTAPSAQRWVAELADAWPRHVAMAVTTVDERDPIGVVGLWDIDWLARKAEFRIVLGYYRQRGIGTEATRLMLTYGFRALDLHRIWLGTAADNTAARRCFEKAGFREEGILREDFLAPDGRRVDNVRYGLLKTEWATAP